MRKIVTLIAALTTSTALAMSPAQAVKNGTLDGGAHPFVGLMVAQDSAGNPLWRCSGTLLSPRVFLTAGHCTEAPAAHAEIWFDADVESGIPANGYPNNGQVGGTPHTHPDYDSANFALRDVGVIELDADVVMPRYGQLPGVNAFDAWQTARGQQKVTFTSVGYGLQESFPDAASWKEQNVRVRMVALPKLVTLNSPGSTGDFSLRLSNNAATGGTCFGDSGGPNFLGETDVLAGVTSYAVNGNCAGTGGVFRLDRSWAQDFVKSFL